MDAWSLINNDLQTIASQWHINIQDLTDGVPVPIPNLADKLDDVQKLNILCILDIDGPRNGIIEIPGFNSNELKRMLDSVSTNWNNLIYNYCHITVFKDNDTSFFSCCFFKLYNLQIFLTKQLCLCF